MRAVEAATSAAAAAVAAIAGRRRAAARGRLQPVRAVTAAATAAVGHLVMHMLLPLPDAGKCEVGARQ